MIFTLPEIGHDPVEPNSGDCRITGTPSGRHLPGCKASASVGVSSLLNCPGFGPGSFGGLYGAFTPMTVRADTITEGR